MFDLGIALDEGSAIICCLAHRGSVVKDGSIGGFVCLWGKICRVWLVVLDVSIDDV